MITVRFSVELFAILKRMAILGVGIQFHSKWRIFLARCCLLCSLNENKFEIWVFSISVILIQAIISFTVCFYIFSGNFYSMVRNSAWLKVGDPLYAMPTWHNFIIYIYGFCPAHFWENLREICIYFLISI